MSGKDMGQSSLFAGMNIGNSGELSGLTSLDLGGTKVEAKFTALEKRVEEPKSKLTSGAPKQSGFSFISHGDLANQTSDQEIDVLKSEPYVKVSSDKTLLDLLETPSEGDSVADNENELLSYSDQLAEILPMTNPMVDSMTPMSVSADLNEEDPSELLSNVPDDTSCLDVKDKSVTEENTTTLCEPESDEPTVNTMTVQSLQDAKYNFVLEPEDNLSLFLSQHSFKLDKLRSEREKLQRNLRVVYEDVKNKIISLEETLNSLKSKFEDAVLDDDYDLAAEINEKIEEVTSEKYDSQSTRPDVLNCKTEEYLNEVAILREKETEFHHWALLKYDELEKEQNAILQEHRNNCTEGIDTKKQDLELQRDEINRSLEHIYLDKAHLNKDRTELDQKIDSKLQVFQDRKKDLVEKQRCLDEEIKTLEKRLKKLKTERGALGIAIEREDDKMNNARNEFGSLEAKLQEKNDRIQIEEETLKGKLEQLGLEEKQLNDLDAQNKDKEESLIKNISYLVSNKTESEKLVQASQKQTTTISTDVFLTKPSEENNDLKNIRTVEKEKAADLENLQLEVFRKKQQIMTKQKRLDEIQNQVPEFEKAKKVAVTDHNFKEAKRLNEILKQLSSEIESTRRDVQQMESALEEENNKAATLKEETKKLKTDVVAAKENHDLAVLGRIVNKITMLVKDEKRICEDSLLETLRKAELDVLKTEFSFLEIPSEDVMTKMDETDKRNLAFVQEFLEFEKKDENPPAEVDDSRKPDGIA